MRMKCVRRTVALTVLGRGRSARTVREVVDGGETESSTIQIDFRHVSRFLDHSSRPRLKENLSDIWVVKWAFGSAHIILVKVHVELQLIYIIANE